PRPYPHPEPWQVLPTSALAGIGGSTVPPRSCPEGCPGLSFPYPRKRKVFRCFLVVFPFPQTVHVTHWAPMLRMWWGMCLELCVSVWLLLPVSRAVRVCLPAG